MGAEDAFEEESVACVDRSANPDGRVNPGVEVSVEAWDAPVTTKALLTARGSGAHILSVESLGIRGAETHN
jgi:hypothetical protein